MLLRIPLPAVLDLEARYRRKATSASYMFPVLGVSTFKGAMILFLESLGGTPPQWNEFQKVGYALIEDYADDPEVPSRDASGARSR